tara:strand:+ start:163 stop:462 length:300 start_codon:yes stop_codon:yes gene_type:complete
MINIKNLKMGDRVQFADKTFAQVTNYETDISNQLGTVVNWSNNNKGIASHIWIKLDIRNKHFDCDEWGNAVQFNLTDEMDGGTSVNYLKKAKQIEEEGQ